MQTLTMSRAHLRELTTTHKRVAGRSFLPSIECVHLHAYDGVLTVSSTNLDVTLRTEVNVADTGPFDLHVNVKRLHDTLNGRAATVTLVRDGEDVTLVRDADTVKIVQDGDTVTVTNGVTTTVLPVDRHLAEDFPVLPIVDGLRVPLDADTLARVAVSASSDATRPVLTGVCVDTEGYACSTDSYRMHYGQVAPNGLGAELLIPASAIAHVVKGEGLSIARDGDRFSLSCMMVKGPAKQQRRTRTEVVGTSIDGPFPNWRKLLPGLAEATTVTVDDPKHLADTARTWHKTQDNVNVPTVLVMNGTVQASCGDSRATFVGGTSDGETIEAGYNGRYLADALDAVGPNVTMHVRGGLKPLIVKGDKVSALLMPMRVA